MYTCNSMYMYMMYNVGASIIVWCIYMYMYMYMIQCSTVKPLVSMNSSGDH